MLILIALLAVVAAVLLFAALQPSDFVVRRSSAFKAKPEAVFPLISDFHNWPQWSPWEKMDLAMMKTHSGAPSGKGAVYEWNGNNKVGQGRMEITAVEPARKVTIKLDFLKPFEAHNTAEFTLSAQDGGTEVSWAMSGQKAYMMKVMGLFMNMDKMIGKDFEAGLANMKAAAEKAGG